MKANVYGKSNAVLSHNEDGIIAIIECEPKEDLTHKLTQAIRDHYALDSDIKIEIKGENELTNQEGINFEVDWTEDEQENIHDFDIQIFATY